MSRAAFLSVIVLLAALLLSRPAFAGNTYALVVGISDYLGSANDLKGAANDARDIASALKKAGAKKVLRFIDRDATRQAIENSWYELVKLAKAGDTIIFTYAGHGSQEPEPAGRGGEEDGLNENFLLSNFSPSGKGSIERIVDDEIFLWFKKADEKKINVVFVADSCHSGTMHRSVGNTGVRYRKGNFRSISSDQLKYPSADTAKLGLKELSHVTFVGATSDDRLTPEILIDGIWRGALSWSFARAIEGAADKDSNGFVDQFELLTYVVPAVQAYAEGQQTPQIQPIRAKPLSLFSVGDTKVASRTSSFSIFGEARGAKFDSLRVAVRNGDASAIKDVPFVDLVADLNEAEIVWDGRTGRVEHSVGGTVAEHVTAATIAPVLTKWVALKWLKRQMTLNPVSAKLPLGNHRYKKGEVVELEISGARYPYLTLFNLPPNGRVEFFIPESPTSPEVTKDWRKSQIRQKFRVDKPPFGAEHLVAIFSKEILRNLHTVLSTMKTAEQAGALPTVLQEFLKGQEFQVGVLSIYTGQ